MNLSFTVVAHRLGCVLVPAISIPFQTHASSLAHLGSDEQRGYIEVAQRGGLDERRDWVAMVPLEPIAWGSLTGWCPSLRKFPLAFSPTRAGRWGRPAIPAALCSLPSIRGRQDADLREVAGQVPVVAVLHYLAVAVEPPD